MRYPVAVIFLLTLIGPVAVRADWQYTKWGMTPEQTIAASGGTAVSTTEEEKRSQSPANKSGEALVKAPYQSGDFQFNAYFIFRKDRLVAVSLGLKDSTITSAYLLSSIQLKYGKPLSETRDSAYSVLTWRNQDEQITIMTIGKGESLSINYQALRTADNEGL